MLFKKSHVFWGGTVLSILAMVCSVRAETARISLFRGVDIPFGFKSGDIVVGQGKYDIEIHFYKVDTNVFYILKLMKKGRQLYDIPGQAIKYSAQTIQELRADPKIPDEPTIRIRKLPGGNLVDFIFESGKKAYMPFQKAYFRVEQLQE